LEDADLELRLIFSLYKSAAIFLDDEGLWVKTADPQGVFLSFLL